MTRSLSLVLALALLAGPALGSGLANTFARMGFGDGDFTTAMEAAATLLEDGEPTVGEIAEWTNERTDAIGTVEFTEVFTREDGSQCVRLKHLAQSGQMTSPAEFTNLRCKSDDAKWLNAVDE